MKKFFKLAAIVMLGVLASCSNDFKTTDNGLMYKFIEQNKDAAQVQMGDVLVGTCVVRLNDSILAQVDKPDRLMMVQNSLFPGDINEGLLMLHVGDKAIIGVDADQMTKVGATFPPYYKAGTGMKVYYEINLTDIISQDEMQQEQANFMKNMQEIHEAEKEILAQYAKDNNIKATPDENGLYIIVRKKGNGPKVEIGRQVAMNYTGRLLDGKVFDTSVETVAKENNMYEPSRKYEPLSYKVGEQSLIEGWEKGVINQPAGSKLTLIIPSSMAYGPRAIGDIPANSPLVFDIEIASVK